MQTHIQPITPETVHLRIPCGALCRTLERREEIEEVLSAQALGFRRSVLVSPGESGYLHRLHQKPPCPGPCQEKSAVQRDGATQIAEHLQTRISGSARVKGRTESDSWVDFGSEGGRCSFGVLGQQRLQAKGLGVQVYKLSLVWISRAHGLL